MLEGDKTASTVLGAVPVSKLLSPLISVLVLLRKNISLQSRARQGSGAQPVFIAMSLLSLSLVCLLRCGGHVCAAKLSSHSRMSEQDGTSASSYRAHSRQAGCSSLRNTLITTMKFLLKLVLTNF